MNISFKKSNKTIINVMSISLKITKQNSNKCNTYFIKNYKTSMFIFIYSGFIWLALDNSLFSRFQSKKSPIKKLGN